LYGHQPVAATSAAAAALLLAAAAPHSIWQALDASVPHVFQAQRSGLSSAVFKTVLSDSTGRSG
jgi:hypothetical protein